MPRSLLPSLSRSKSCLLISSTVLARGERAAVVCEEFAHGGPKGLCVRVTLLFCEFGGGAVAHGRSVTIAVRSVAREKDKQA